MVEAGGRAVFCFWLPGGPRPQTLTFVMSIHRSLRFRSLDDARQELARIESSVVEATGLWSLGQIYNHLSESLEHCTSSYPRYAPTFLRRTIGPLAFRSMRNKGYMPPGSMNPDAPRAREDQDAEIAMRRLWSALDRFEAFDGTHPEHPFFGSLTREEWRILQTFHLANHLGYVQIVGPRAGEKSARAKSTPSRRPKSSAPRTSSGAKKKKTAKKKR